MSIITSTDLSAKEAQAAPSAEPSPRPEMAPQLESEPEAKPQPTPESKPETNPESKLESKSEPETEPESAPQREETTTAEHDILPASHWAEQARLRAEADESTDNDSAYAESIASSTASLSASILEYRTIHGRSFHSERGNAQSWNPNDARHDESMDILHHVSTLHQDGKIFLAPLKDNIHKALDVGCGTGIWAIDFADLFPGTEVTGVDISPQQPHWIPPNLTFEVDDVTQDWTWDNESFDYIHMRWLVGSIPDWYEVFRQVYKTLKPGGYFESKESSCVIQSDDGTVAEGSALNQWGKVFLEAGKKFGRTFAVVEEGTQRKAMEAAGFVDIVEYDFKTIIGPWPKDSKGRNIGKYMQLSLQQDIEGFVVYLWSTVMGWTKEEILIYAAHLRRELRSGKHHAWFPQKVVIGRKPELGEIPR